MPDTLCLFGDSLCSHGVLPRMGEAVPFVPASDAVIGVVETVCVVALVLALSGETRGLKERLLALAAPSGSRTAQEQALAQVSAGERWRALLYPLLLSVAVGLAHLSLTLESRPVVCGIYATRLERPVTPAMLVAADALLCMAVLALRHLLYLWVHATFFRRDARMRWRRAYHLFMALETAVAMPLACALAAGEYDTQILVYSAILSLVLVKMGLLWCSWRMFFVKPRAWLHFFAYLCSAELIPLAILWLLLDSLTGVLTV